MKAVVWTRPGPPDVLRIQEVAKPAPKDNEVLIRIHATTVTTADCELRKSNAPRVFQLFRVTKPGPFIMGQELAGVIEAIGKAVTRFRPGDQVAAWSGLRLGTYAEYTCLPDKAVMTRMPATISYEQAAPLPVGGLDAAYFMRQASIQRGERVLIVGAGGTIGTYAVQLARYFGAVVTGVDSAGKLDMLRSIGAEHVIDYAKEDFTQSGKTYDVIFDVIGKSAPVPSMKMLSSTGRYLLANPQITQMARGRLLALGSRKRVIPWSTRSAGQYADDFEFLKARMEAGEIKSIIDRTYPMEQAADAHRYVESGLKQGHVILRVD